MNTPTPAPALTDEQIEEWHDWYAKGWDRKKFDAWLTAVIARAKREEREAIATELAEAAQLRARQIAHDQIDRDRGEVYAYRIAERIATEGRNA